MIFGTFYSVTYQSGESLHEKIQKELERFDGSLSMFNDTSTLSRINRGETTLTDPLTRKVLERSLEISRETGGAFDITIAPLVNAWGFGWKTSKMPTQEVVDSLLEFTGYEKIHMDGSGNVTKDDERINLDCSAIAKGYAVDVVASLLEREGVKNYMVNIGGEVDVKGQSPSKELWKIGINRPEEDSLSKGAEELQLILSITSKGIATSGNYRNFYYKDGKRYAHTIDPHSGYPIEHSVLSATVIADDCMSADGYATSFMVMGEEKAKEFLLSHPDLDAFLILSSEDGEDFRTWSTPGIEKYLPKSPAPKAQ